MKILILIPSYNDSRHLLDLIKRIHLNTATTILIIDDGSEEPISLTDVNVKIIRNKYNLGKGGALKNGFKYASIHGFSHAITIDSDLQHDPDKLNSFIDYDENCDLVCGNREIGKAMPFHRQVSNKLTSYIVSILCGQKIYDSQCGYRRYNVQSVLALKCQENGFQFESEVLIKLCRSGALIGQVRIPTIYGNETSSIRSIQDTFKFIKLISGYIWQIC